MSRLPILERYVLFRTDFDCQQIEIDLLNKPRVNEQLINRFFQQHIFWKWIKSGCDQQDIRVSSSESISAVNKSKSRSKPMN